MPRVIYIPAPVKLWHDYSVRQRGGDSVDLPYFIGQRGNGLGSIFRRLWTFVKPVLWSAGKSAGKAIGRQALSSTGDVIKDVITGQSVSDSLKTRGKEALSSLAGAAADHLKEVSEGMRGSGLGVSPIGIHGNVRLMRSHTKRRKSKKRLQKRQLGGGRRKGKRGKKKRKNQPKRAAKKRRGRSHKLKDIFG